jgi:hypothetical protein
MSAVTRRALAVAFVPVLVLAACGDDDGGGSNGTTTSAAADATTTSAPAETSTTEQAAAVTTLELTAADYSFDPGGVATAPAGQLHISLTNNGAEEHQATLVQLKDGKTLADLAAAGSADPTGREALALFDGYGGPNVVAPGDTQAADAVLAPGEYVFLCLIPSPSDGVAHASKGMVLPFTITEGETSTAAPAAADTLVVGDFEFGVPEGFTGQGTFTVDNRGPQPHEIAVYRINDGSTFEDVQAFFFEEGASPGPPPFTSSGGVAPLAPGFAATVDLDLEAGSYAFVCFLPDVDTGQPHFTLGMLQEVTVD